MGEKDFNPYCLMPGEIVNLPEKTQKFVKLKPDVVNEFVVKELKAGFSMVLQSSTRKPLCNIKYRLYIDDQDPIEGVTDDVGLLQCELDPDAKIGKLHAFPYNKHPEREVVHYIQLGRLDPVGEISGQQSRLHQLGYHVGAPDNKDGKVTQEAHSKLENKKIEKNNQAT